MDIIIEQYDEYLSDLLDKHAPKKHIYRVGQKLGGNTKNVIFKM